jgi:hypothetical protein
MPRWLFVLIVVAVAAFVGNALGLFHIHGSVSL